MQPQRLAPAARTEGSRRPGLPSAPAEIRIGRALFCSTALAGLLAGLAPATPARAQTVTTGGDVITTTPVSPVSPGAQPSPWSIGNTLIVGESGTGSLDIEDGGVVNSANGGIVGNAGTARGTVTVSGLGSVWNTGTAVPSLIVGNFGGGELNIVRQGKVNSDGAVVLGNFEGSSGTIVVKHGGELAATGALVVGQSGAGSLAVWNGVVTSFRGAIGNGLGSGGAVTVTGPFSTWTNTDILVVGGSGSGTLDIENGGSVSNTHSAIGGTPGTVGIVSVSGPGSTWTNNGNVDVGYEGAGTLRILDGGVVSNVSAHLGTAAGSSGTVTVAGANSKWTNNSFLSVGYDGTGKLDITSGGSVSSIDGYVGFRTGSNGMVAVDGAGSKWRTVAALRVGVAGTGSLDVTGNGSVASFGGYIGDQVASNGIVTVDGTGSEWSTGGIGLTVGNAGTGTLNIANGGTVVNGAGHVGFLGSASGTVNVDGTYSTWRSSDIHIGAAGAGRLNVTNGGKVSDVSGYIGDEAGSDGAVVVDGTGSAWTNAGNIHVGDGGRGSLDIRNGGIVTNGFAYVGHQLGSVGTVNVNGPDSVWTNANDLYLGNDGTGMLNIGNGGSVSNLDSYVGASGIGEVTVDGAGSTWTNQTLFLGHAGTGTLRITNGGRVDSPGASIGYASGSSGSAVVDGAGSIWVGGLLGVGSAGDGVLTVANGGEVEAAVGIVLGSNGGQGQINIGADAGNSPVAAGTLDTPLVGFDTPNSSLVFNHTSAGHIFAPELRGNGIVSHLAGTTTLTADSGSFTGSADVSGGTLRVDGTLGAAGTSVAVGSGGTLGGGGTIGGDVTVASGGTLAGAAGSTLTMGNLVLDAGAVIDVSLGAPSMTALFEVANNLTLDGTVDVTGQPGFGAGLYRLFDYGGALTDNGLAIGTTPAGYSAGDLTVQTAIAGQVNLLAATPVVPLTFWNGGVTAADGTIHGGAGTWDAATTNWTDAAGTDSGPYDPAGLLIFSGAPGTVTVDDGAGPIRVETGMQFAVDGYAVAGDDIGLAGATVIRVGDGTGAGASYTATIGSRLAGAGSLEKTDLGTLVLTGANTYSGGTTISAGTLIGDTTSLQGGITNNAALIFAQSADGSFAGSVSGTGSLTKDGAGALTLTGSNAYSGGTIISAGTLIGDTTSLQGDILDNATLVFDQGGAGTLAGSISGSGSLIKEGSGTLTLTGTNSYAGGTTVIAGTLIGDTASLQGGITNNAALVFDQAADGTYAGLISGTGVLIKDGSGALTLTGANTYSGGTTVAAGTLIGDTASLQGDITNDAELVFDQSADGSFSDAISGAGSVTKTGAGALTYTGVNTYAGGTVVDGGSLIVDGTLAGDILVDTNAMLGGIGSIGGQVIVGTGGTLAPGNSIGTLNLADAVFDAGSIYEVELDDGGFVAGTNNDLVNASGAVAINGGTVHVTPENRSDDGTTYLPGTYTIITAAAGVTGTFDTVTDDFAFLDFTDSYDAGNVFLTSSIGVPGFCLAGYSANQCATGDGVFSLGGGTVYTAVLNLSTAEAPVALDRLSGEIHASAQTALIDDSRFAREAMMDRLRGTLGGTASNREGTAKRRIHDGFAFWGRGFGSWGSWSGDGNAAEFDRSIGGFFLGGDALVTEKMRLGIFAGYGGSSFGADDRNSTGSADTWHLGAYGGTEFGNLGLRFGGAYAWHDIETNRSVAFTGFSDNLSGRYDARTGQIFGEAGYRFDHGAASFEPFANLAYVHLGTDGYAESGGAAALTAGSGSMDATFATVGLRAETQIDLGGPRARIFGMAGWRHAFGDVASLATHALAGGDNFTVGGVPTVRDALVLDLGASVDLTPNATLGISYSGRFGPGSTEQGVNANLTVRF